MIGRARCVAWVLGLGVSLSAVAQEPTSRPTVSAPLPTPAPVMPTTVPARVDVTVRVIRASRDGDRMDPELASWASALRRTPFTSFSVIDDRHFRLTDGATQMFGVMGGYDIGVTLASHNETQAKVQMTSRRRGLEPIEADLTIKRDRAFMYVIRTDDPDVALLLKVDVRY